LCVHGNSISIIAGKRLALFVKALKAPGFETDIIDKKTYNHSSKMILMKIGRKERSVTPKYPKSIEINKGIPFQYLKIKIIFETENKKKKINISFVLIPKRRGINTFGVCHHQ